MTKKGFLKIDHALMEAPAWQALSDGAGWLLIDLWGRYNGRNNGEIAYSLRETQKRFGWSPKRAVRLFAELEEKGFVVATRRGSFEVKTGAFIGRSTTWRLTMLPCDGSPATHDYRTWIAPLDIQKPASETEAHRLPKRKRYDRNRLPKRKSDGPKTGFRNGSTYRSSYQGAGFHSDGEGADAPLADVDPATIADVADAADAPRRWTIDDARAVWLAMALAVHVVDLAGAASPRGTPERAGR